MVVNYSLLITANPLFNSAAAKMVFKTIRCLDILSKDIDVFMPGFHSSKSSVKDSDEVVKQNIAEIKAAAEQELDYHYDEPVYHTYCESAGDMYFSDVDFSRFMIDMHNACPNLEYVGRTELAIIPSVKGGILYDKAKSYNLEPFVNGRVKDYSLEEFFLAVFNIIKDTCDDEELTVINQINSLYQRKTQPLSDSNSTDVTIRVDNLILKHMRWAEHAEGFFISYSTKDKFDAYALKALLEREGKPVWMAPEGIPSGVDYMCAIPAAVRITSRFVILLSNNSAQSDWVRREIEQAVKNRKPIDGIFVGGFTQEDVAKYDWLDFILAPLQMKYSANELFEDKQVLLDFINKSTL